MKKSHLAVLLTLGLAVFTPLGWSVDLLTELAARGKTVARLEGHFEQEKQIAVLPMPVKSSGRFTVVQGKEVVWETLVPVVSSLRVTPGGITLDSASASDSAVKQPGAELVAKIFMGVIAGELRGLEDYFTVEALGDVNQWRIRLTPRTENLAAYITSIELRGAQFTEQLDMDEANGDRSRIVFVTDRVERISPDERDPQ